MTNKVEEKLTEIQRILEHAEKHIPEEEFKELVIKTVKFLGHFQEKIFIDYGRGKGGYTKFKDKRFQKRVEDEINSRVINMFGEPKDDFQKMVVAYIALNYIPIN
jgi:hypothetical protein